MIEEALSEIKDRLAIDGYELHVEEKGGDINITIKAGPEACEDCLSPKPILERMISSDLEQSGISYNRLNIFLP